MKIEDVRSTAFAMPLTSPSFPRGPYRFIDREYLVITYRTDPAALDARGARAAQGRGAAGALSVHPHAGFQRLRRVRGVGAGDPRHL